jgi:hypothetical protein
MTLIGIQTRFREVGRIRTGEKVTRNGKTYPSRLDTFRFTSTDRSVLEAVAEKYGGTVEPWEHGFQVTTTSDRISVMLPPRGTVESHSLWYELWSGGGIERRCDGETALVGGQDGQCVCDPDARMCKPTLRVSFLLPDLPGLGVWRLETKGYNAAAELPGTLNLLAAWADQGRPVRGILRLEQRESIREGKKKLYAVPVLDPVGTIDAVLAGAGGGPSLPAPATPLLGDDLPAPPQDNEPAGSVVREDTGAVQAPPPAEAESSAAEEGVHQPAPSSDQIQARYDWAVSKGWTTNWVDEWAVSSDMPTLMEQTPEEWAIFARTIKDGPPEPDITPDTEEAASYPDRGEPPRQNTDEYRALSVTERKAAREYWVAKDVPA